MTSIYTSIHIYFAPNNPAVRVFASAAPWSVMVGGGLWELRISPPVLANEGDADQQVPLFLECYSSQTFVIRAKESCERCCCCCCCCSLLTFFFIMRVHGFKGFPATHGEKLTNVTALYELDRMLLRAD